VSDSSAATAEPSLAVRIDRQKAHPLTWQAMVKRAAVVAIAGISIYLVFPAITEVLASWPRLSTLDPRWFALAIGAEVGHFFCTFALQRLALRTRAWFPVVTSQLAGNAITLIMPGGAAVGAAVQFRMLAASGKDTSSTVGGLTAFSLLGVGGLLALPVFALPVILVGAPTNRGPVNAAILGAAGFAAFAAFGAVVLATTHRCAGAAGRRSGPGTGSCAGGPRSPGWMKPCSPSATRSGRRWASSGGRRSCSPLAAWRSTTCACWPPCGPLGPGPARR
jgi:hypothetical protein